MRYSEKSNLYNTDLCAYISAQLTDEQANEPVQIHNVSDVVIILPF